MGALMSKRRKHVHDDADKSVAEEHLQRMAMRVPCINSCLFPACKNFYNPMTYVRRSHIPDGGCGLFALEDIDEDQWISEFGPLQHGPKRGHDWCLSVHGKAMSPVLNYRTLGEPLAAWCNHTCEQPNAAFVLVEDIDNYDGLEEHLENRLQPPALELPYTAPQCKTRMFVRALRPIAKDSEILITYSDELKNFECKCPACQK